MAGDPEHVIKDSSRKVLGPEAYEELSKEEIEALRDKAQKLLNKEGFIKNAAAVLIAANQLYAMALQALSRRCDMLGVDQLVETFIVQSMLAHAKREEFTRDQIVKKMHGLVLPFVLAEQQDEGDREKELVEAERSREDQARRKVPISLPFRPDSEWEQPPTLERGQVMVLAGHPGAVKFAIGEVVSHALKAKDKRGGFKPSVMRLLESVRPHNTLYSKKDAGTKQLFEVGVNRWLNCGASMKSIREALKVWIRLLRKQRLDLLVIDNLAWGMPREHLPPQVNAGACQKMFKKYAEEVGCAVVAGLPLGEPDQKPVDVIDWTANFDNTWTQLAIYTSLVQVGVETDGAETYTLFTTRNLDRRKRVGLANEVSRYIIDDVTVEPPTEEGSKDNE